MTIKQHGGIFGRNPKFYNVEAEGTISADGNISSLSEIEGRSLHLVEPSASPCNVLLENDEGSVLIRADGDFALLRADQFIFQNSGGGDRIDIVDGNLKPQSGNGIDFSATSDASGSTSELFDDYEEGTWTPSFVGSTSGSLSFGTVNQATYTKIGRLVYLNCYLSSGDILNNTVSGNIEISGMPFSADPFSAQVTVVLCNLFNFDETDIAILGYTTGSKLRFVKGSSNSVISDADLNTTGAAGTIMLQATYEAL